MSGLQPEGRGSIPRRSTIWVYSSKEEQAALNRRTEAQYLVDPPRVAKSMADQRSFKPSTVVRFHGNPPRGVSEMVSRLSDT